MTFSAALLWLLLPVLMAGLGWWWRRGRTASLRAEQGSAGTRGRQRSYDFLESPTSVAAVRAAAARRAARTVSPEPAEPDVGPATVMSYLDVGHGATQPGDLSPLVAHLAGTDAQATPDPLQSQALHAMALGQLDEAWDLLQGGGPRWGQKAPGWLQALERLALAFEGRQRFDRARDVYERIADTDPEWRHVKLRLMRARGLAQNAKLNTWGTVPPQPLPQMAMRQLGRYLVENEIGRGAMGAVYQGYDPATGQRVALKTMALAKEFSGADLADARARFLREAEMSGRLEHPDIVSIIDAGESDGLAFIAMELVQGRDLSSFTQPHHLLPLATLNGVFIRVAEALAYAHSRGVTHRDIKPGNIMIDLDTDTLKVMDFGVARVADGTRTRTGVVLGTPTFMSPEQLSGQGIDGRSDLYSLGVSMFQLLTGQLPYRNDSMAVLMRAIARDPAPHVSDVRPDVPRELGDVVALALQKHPDTRYADGWQMAADLRAVSALLPNAVDLDLC